MRRKGDNLMATTVEERVWIDNEGTNVPLCCARECRIDLVLRTGCQDNQLLSNVSGNCLDVCLVSFAVRICRVRMKSDYDGLRDEVAQQLKPLCHQFTTKIGNTRNIA